MSGVDEEFCSWAADRLLDQLRCGAAPSGSAGVFAWEPMLSALRSTIRPTDRELVITLLDDDGRYMFGGLLSRAFLADGDMTEAIQRRFRAEEDPERAIGLLHQLSARPLEEPDRLELVQWLTDHADAFVEEQRRFFGGSDGRMRLDHRLTHPDFAEKRWVYLFSALALDPSEDVRLLLDEHLEHSDPVIAQAARAAAAYADAHPPGT